MCLTKIKHFKTDGIGWKVFDQENATDYHSPFYFSEMLYKVNKKYVNQVKLKIHTDEDEPYHVGFHIFTTKKEAEWYKKYLDSNPTNIENFVVKKISYKNVTATGIETFVYFHFKKYWKEKDLKTIVAQEMTICA